MYSILKIDHLNFQISNSANIAKILPNYFKTWFQFFDLTLTVSSMIAINFKNVKGYQSNRTLECQCFTCYIYFLNGATPNDGSGRYPRDLSFGFWKGNGEMGLHLRQVDIEEGFSSFFAKFLAHLMIFQSEVCQSLKGLAKHWKIIK